MMISTERIRQLAEGKAEAAQLHQWRSVWLNMCLGWLHWVHNDLTDDNLKAQHSCPVCREFRNKHWGRVSVVKKPHPMAKDGVKPWGLSL